MAYLMAHGSLIYYMGMSRKKVLILILALVVLATGGFAYAWHVHAADNRAPTHASATTKPSVATQKPAGFDKTQFSLTDPTSLWVVVNKLRPLPQGYVPPDLVTPNVALRLPGNQTMEIRQPVEAAMESMFAAASAAQAPLMISSAYRSYSYQVSLFNSYVNSSGETAAETYSARPGFSEHQTGLAFDVEPLDQKCDVDQCFANLPAGQWVAAHAYEYGFIIRYPADKTPVTGYIYEPWHLRYVGTALALELHQQHIETLEEFFGLPAAPDYAH